MVYLLGAAGQGTFIDPQTVQAIGSALGYLLELDSIIQLLKSLHIWVLEQGELKGILTWTLHPF